MPLNKWTLARKYRNERKLRLSAERLWGVRVLGPEAVRRESYRQRWRETVQRENLKTLRQRSTEALNERMQRRKAILKTMELTEMQRYDVIMTKVLEQKGTFVFEVVPEKIQCAVCQKRKERVFTSMDYVVCADCYHINTEAFYCGNHRPNTPTEIRQYHGRHLEWKPYVDRAGYKRF